MQNLLHILMICHGVFFHGRGRSEKRHFPQKQNQKENAMNLGAFMNPEFPIFSTTLCYLERDDSVQGTASRFSA